MTKWLEIHLLRAFGFEADEIDKLRVLRRIIIAKWIEAGRFMELVS
jgi:hypothetical protein